MKLTYLPGIVIAAIGVAVHALNFQGFDTSEKHTPKTTLAATDVRSDEHRVNEMAMIFNRIEGSKETPKDPIGRGLQAAGVIKSVATGNDISGGSTSGLDSQIFDFLKSNSNDPKINEFHKNLAQALKDVKAQPALDSNQVDLLNR